MSAEILRRAASLMRERAEAATPAPWDVTPGVNLTAGIVRSDAGLGRTPFARATWALDAEHIAAWHPAVALAVADWLEESAEHLDDFGDTPLHHICPTAREGLDCSVLGQALTVARAYLGESS